MQEGITPTVDQIYAGQAVYTKAALKLYDFFVLGFSNRFVWQCPTKRLLELYNSHSSAHHLEIGAGTGYFIDKCRFSQKPSRLVLVDLNANCLAETTHRVKRYNPLAFRRNILEPLNLGGRMFDSVGINYVLHCLPGTMRTKAVVFDHLRQVMNPGAVLFGATTLHAGVHKNILARAFMAMYNRLGIFSNRHDSLEDLRSELAQRFPDIRIDTVGCSGLFLCTTQREAA